MWSAKRTIVIAMLICVGFVPLYGARPAHSKGKLKHPTALELLDKYAETQDKLQSFIAKATVSRNAFSSGLLAGKPWRGRSFTEYDMRFDGKRVSVRSFLWGKVNVTSSFKRADNYYDEILWDGKTYISHWHCDKKKPGQAGRVTIRTDMKDPNQNTINAIGDYGGKFLMGYFYNLNERIDAFLCDAQKLSVREKMDNVGGSQCYVVEGVKKGGVYRIWIDPKHGYNIAKLRIEATTSKAQGLREYFVTFKNVCFQDMGGVWVPIEADMQSRFNYSKGHYCTSNYEIKVTEMFLKPDHEALKSFLPDKIRNGARVWIVGINGKAWQDGEYTWQDGKVVDKDGREVDVDKLIKAESEKVKKPKPKRK